MKILCVNPFPKIFVRLAGIWINEQNDKRTTFLLRSERLDHAEGASTGFMFASGGVLSKGYGHGGPGVCLGNGQTEAEGVPS